VFLLFVNIFYLEIYTRNIIFDMKTLREKEGRIEKLIESHLGLLDKYVLHI